jgi:hypothetical protein
MKKVIMCKSIGGKTSNADTWNGVGRLIGSGDKSLF